MSWLARSLVNSLRPDPDPDPDDAGDDPPAARGNDDDEEEPGTPSRGVKEDLSELKQTLTRQFWGVASFLAPPPESPAASAGGRDKAEEEAPNLAGIRSDWAEIGGRVRSGISMFSSNKAVSEISKIASTIFGSEEDDDEEGVVGVTEEVVMFARDVSTHPATWMNFPLLSSDRSSDDFHMSDVQQEHALAIERLAPTLEALRLDLCPSHMSVGCFWKIYFVLVNPILNKLDAELLSTPQIMQARAMLMQDLPIRTQPTSESSGIDLPLAEEVANQVPPAENVESAHEIPDVASPAKAHRPKKSATSTSMPSTEFETDKHPMETTEVRIIEKSVIEEEPAGQAKSEAIPSNNTLKESAHYEEDGDEWLDEESGETDVSRSTGVSLGNEEDVSFSDLEVDDDDDGGMRLSSKTKPLLVVSQTKEGDWVPVGSGNSSSPQTREANDWLDVDMDTV